MNEYRCKFCHKLLGKLDVQYTPILIEIKCSKCKKMNRFLDKDVKGDANLKVIGSKTTIKV